MSREVQVDDVVPGSLAVSVKSPHGAHPGGADAPATKTYRIEPRLVFRPSLPKFCVIEIETGKETQGEYLLGHAMLTALWLRERAAGYPDRYIGERPDGGDR